MRTYQYINIATTNMGDPVASSNIFCILPIEMHDYISQFLDLKSLSNLIRVNKQTYNIVSGTILHRELIKCQDMVVRDKNKKLSPIQIIFRKACRSDCLYLVQHIEHIHIKEISQTIPNNFRTACATGSMKVIRYFLNQYPDLKKTDGICYACIADRIEIVKFLVANEVNFHMINEKALISACCFGSLKIVEFLVEIGANIHIDNEKPLYAAGKNNHPAIVKFLVEKGANLHIVVDTIILDSCVKGFLQMIKCLAELGVNLRDLCAADFHPPFVIACHYGHLDVVLFLIEQGINVNMNDGKAIQQACISGHKKIVQILMEHGANFRSPQLLVKACEYGQIDILKLLVEQGADLDACDDYNMDLIRMTFNKNINHENHYQIIQYLLSKGLELDETHDRFLYWACKKGDFELAKLFLEHGANPNYLKRHFNSTNLKCSKRHTNNFCKGIYCLEIATINNHLNIVQLLIKYGANFRHPKYIETLMREGSWEIIEWIINVTSKCLDFRIKQSKKYFIRNV